MRMCNRTGRMTILAMASFIAGLITTSVVLKPSPQPQSCSVFVAERNLPKMIKQEGPAPDTVQVADGIWLSKESPISWEGKLDSLDNISAEIVLHRYLQERHICCETSMRIGHKADGGWDVCTSGPFKHSKLCKVYSFGIARDFSFDDRMGSTFGCEVKSFDPSPSSMKKTYRRNKHVMFYDIGISGRDHVTKHGWHMRTFSSLLSKFGDKNSIIDYLKIDVEGAEWEALPDMMTAGSLANVKQLAFEVHRYSHHKPPQLLYKLLRTLEQHGFRKWLVHYNPIRNTKIRSANITYSKAVEIYLLNMNFIKGARSRAVTYQVCVVVPPSAELGIEHELHQGGPGPGRSLTRGV